MSFNRLKRIGRGAAIAVFTMSLSIVLAPTLAYADLNDDFESKYISDADYYDSEGERADEAFWLNVEAKNGQTVSKASEDIDAPEGFGGAQAKSSGDGSTATATVDGSIKAGGTGVSANSRRGSATVEAGDVTADTDGKFGAFVSSWYENSTATANLGNVSAGAGIRVESNRSGTANLTAGDVKVTKGDATNFNANSISSSRGGKTSVEIGNVTSVSTGLVLSAGGYGGASTTTVKAGTVTADIDGLMANADDDGKISATVNGIGAKNDAIEIRNMGGQSAVIVEGDAASSGGNGLVYMNIGGGTATDTVLVTETLSGATNGVVLGMGGSTLDLTTWKIEAGSGSVIANDKDDAFAKSVNYIVKLDQPAYGAALSAVKADGSPLDKSQGYEVAKEADKVVLKVSLEEGYEISGAYNGKDDLVELLKDENGDYYIVVARGGGVFLSVVLSEGDAMTLPADDEQPTTTKAATAKATSASEGSSLPKTGDTPLVPLALMTMLLSSVALIACLKKHRHIHSNR